ncbi:hypothetical protein [Oryzobacter terrae]|uniref:sunset domain-containing protein n=1 Tax=Oryzobacter terrae TaxID=1620385 RepID=UPI00366C6407
MTTTQLLLLLLLVIVVVIAVVWLMRRGAGQKAAARVEAEEIRGRAQEVGASLPGQQAFAEQAEERAAVARAEAEQRAAEAARLEEEANAHRAAAAETQREYETQMRRADDVDPDVKESSFAPVPAEEPDAEPAAATAERSTDGEDGAPAAAADTSPTAGSEDEALPTRAERRAAREQAESEESSSPVPAVTGAAVAGAAAAGASSWGDRDREQGGDADADSERVASATDYRDDVSPEGRRPADVSTAAGTGTAAGMSDETRRQDHTDTDLSRDVESPSGEWGGPPRDEQGDLGGDETTTASRAAADGDANDADDDSVAAGDAGAATHDGDAGAATHDGDAPPTIIGDVEEFASTEPLLTEDQTPPVQPEADGGADSSHDHDRDEPTSEARDDVATADSSDGDAAAVDHQSTPTATADDDISTAASDSTDSAESTHSGDRAQEPTIIGDIEDFASTEPLLTGDQTAPVESEVSATEATHGSHDAGSHEADSSEASDASDVSTGTDAHDADGPTDTPDAHGDTDEHVTAETGAAVATSSDVTDGTDEHTEGSSEERFDPTPTRDWAADEGELLEENRERGAALEEDRAGLAADESDATDGAVTTTDDGTTDDGTTDGNADGDTDALPAQTDEGTRGKAARRISEFHELRDGGYGVGSAATLDDGAQPLDHPIAGYRDTMTFRSPGDEGYDDAQPDVWFYDQDAAERSGFSRSEV